MPRWAGLILVQHSPFAPEATLGEICPVYCSSGQGPSEVTLRTADCHLHWLNYELCPKPIRTSRGSSPREQPKSSA